MGQTYILDFTEMQQVRILSVLDALCMEHASSDHEETGTSRAIRRTTVDALIKRSQSSSETEVLFTS